jgi:hypothetical protein
LFNIAVHCAGYLSQSLSTLKELLSVPAEYLARSFAFRGGQNLAHHIERQVDGPQGADEPGLADLAGSIASVSGRRVDGRWREQADFVIMPEGID